MHAFLYFSTHCRSADKDAESGMVIRPIRSDCNLENPSATLLTKSQYFRALGITGGYPGKYFLYHVLIVVYKYGLNFKKANKEERHSQMYSYTREQLKHPPIIGLSKLII